MKMEWQLRDVGRASWDTGWSQGMHWEAKVKDESSRPGIWEEWKNVVSAGGGYLKTNSGLLVLCRPFLDTNISDWLIQFKSVRVA